MIMIQCQADCYRCILIRKHMLDVLVVKKYIFTVYNEEAKIVIHFFLHGAIQH